MWVIPGQREGQSRQPHPAGKDPGSGGDRREEKGMGGGGLSFRWENGPSLTAGESQESGSPDGSHCRLREGNAPARGCFPGASGSLSSLSSKGPCAAAAPPGGAVGKAGPTLPSPQPVWSRAVEQAAGAPWLPSNSMSQSFPQSSRRLDFPRVPFRHLRAHLWVSRVPHVAAHWARRLPRNTSSELSQSARERSALCALCNLIVHEPQEVETIFHPHFVDEAIANRLAEDKILSGLGVSQAVRSHPHQTACVQSFWGESLPHFLFSH